MTAKFTPTRRKHLEAVRDHHCIHRWPEWGGGFSWSPWSFHLRPSTMEWLLDNGLIRLERADAGWNAPYRAELTDAGREALEAGR